MSILNKIRLKPFSNQYFGVLPTDLSNLVLWLDASDSSTITESSGFVSQWNDKSGNNNHAVQSTGSSQPFYSDNSVLFDGVDDEMFITHSTNLEPGDNNFSLFFVVNSLDDLFKFIAAKGNGNSSTDGYSLIRLTGIDAARFYNGTSNFQHNFNVTKNNINFIGLLWDGSDFRVFLNNKKISTIPYTGSIQLAVNFFLGSRGGSLFSNMVYHELIGYKGYISDYDVLSLYNHLQLKWDI